MRITKSKLRFALVVFPVLLAAAFSLFTGVNHRAYAAPAGVSGCSQYDAGVASGSQSQNDFANGVWVATVSATIDFMVNPNNGEICQIRARGDVFPIKGKTIHGPFTVYLCYNTPAVVGCDMGGLSEDISGSYGTTSCATYGYPNHCAVVGPWVNSACYFSPSSLDSAIVSADSNINSMAEAYSWFNSWC